MQNGLRMILFYLVFFPWLNLCLSSSVPVLFLNDLVIVAPDSGVRYIHSHQIIHNIRGRCSVIELKLHSPKQCIFGNNTIDSEGIGVLFKHLYCAVNVLKRCSIKVIRVRSTWREQCAFIGRDHIVIANAGEYLGEFSMKAKPIDRVQITHYYIGRAEGATLTPAK